METREEQLTTVLDTMVKHEKTLGHLLENELNKELSQDSIKEMHDIIKQNI